MKKLALTIAATAAFLCCACVQMPTERASVVDTRPQLSFHVVGDAESMTVLVDDLQMGSVKNYLEGDGDKGGAALRVLPGAHVVKIVQDGKVIHEENIYVGDGVSKTIQVL